MRWRRLLIAAVVVLCLPFAAKTYVQFSVVDRVFSDVTSVPHCRVAMVLGAKIPQDGSLSPSVASRVDTAIALYRAGKCDKLLMSGDNRYANRNQPARMRDYAINRGVPAKRIALDYSGMRTYDSAYRARYVYGLRKIIIVTERFHVDRAVFLAKQLGIDAYGVEAPNKANTKAMAREYLACLKAISDVYLLHPHPAIGKREAI